MFLRNNDTTSDNPVDNSSDNVVSMADYDTWRLAKAVGVLRRTTS